MTEEKSRPYAFGRRQFIAVQQTVSDMLNQGYPLTQVHKKLVSEGKLTISYSALASLVRHPARRSGKKDFLSCRVEVITMLAEGYSLAMIHSILIERGALSCGYEQFTRYVKLYRQKKLIDRDLLEDLQQAESERFEKTPAATPRNPIATVAPALPHKKKSFSEEIEKKKREREGQ